MEGCDDCFRMGDLNEYDEGDASIVELHVGNPTRLWDDLGVGRR